MDPAEQLTRRVLQPFGYRVVATEIPVDDTAANGRLYLPEEVMRGRFKRAIVVDPGEQSGLDAGAVIYYQGEAIDIDGSLVVEMNQIIASEPA